MEDAEIHFISNFFRRNTRSIDNKEYIITYSQLKTILSGFGYGMDNPDSNFINITRDVEVTRGLFQRRKEIEHQRITQISFPGWKNEVSAGTIRKIRVATHLTAKEGIDSKVFFRNATPLQALISRYKSPLESLANR
ncbi:MAG TPA: hypothetical protein VGO50_16375 [Pyrinomonadaceae bacterium]|jgi:hypothetical protein|nr:hypothetical protein [Pyrinomonadaceae bacterium]